MQVSRFAGVIAAYGGRIVLVVAPDRLRLVATSSTTSDDHRSLAWNFSAVVTDPVLRVDDPDGLVLEARWRPC